MASTLHSLPAELLYEIYLLSLSPALGISSRWLYETLKTAPSHIHAMWLLRHSYENFEVAEVSTGLTLAHALKFSLCSLSIVRMLIRLLEPYTPSQHDSLRPAKRKISILLLPKRPFRFSSEDSDNRELGKQSRDSSTLPPSRPSLSNRASQHPNRTESRACETLAMLRELSTHRRRLGYTIDTNAHGGFALVCAVKAGHVPLIQALLSLDADPSMKDHRAIRVAIRQKDLRIVRVLVERTPSKPDLGATNSSEFGDEEGGDRATMDIKRSSSSKRRKLEDRVQFLPSALASEALQVGARDIMDYFIFEKGVSPDIRVLGTLMKRRSSTRRA